MARTIVIKSELTAQFMNDRLVQDYGITSVHPTDMSTWRYYKHVSGEYHPVDKEMFVKSWDTTEDILFSKENLAIHRATARAYAFGSKQFQTLIDSYPDQDLLIMGILYPADKLKAIEADDHTVIAYPLDLIEDNEYSLVGKINTFAKNMMKRWFNKQYCISDNLYASSVYAVLYLQLYLAICNFRLEACKTAEAHSFHIGQYLMSYGVPEEVIPMLTKKQALFLYRNIKYIRIHAGKNDTFHWLIENFFTERNLPLCKYTMRHFDDGQVENLYPTVAFKSLSLNDVVGETQGDIVDTETLLYKEVNTAISNPQFIQDNSEAVDFRFATANSNVVQTKVLESALTDYTNAVYTSIDQIFMSYWPYLAKLGKLLYFVNFTNLKTGESNMISANDAFVLMMYAGARALGFEMVTVPAFFCERVIRWPSPDVDDYKSISKTITDSEIEHIRGLIPEIDGFVSIDSFNAFCYKVQQMEYEAQKMYSKQGHHFRRAEMKAVVLRSFTDSWVDLESAGTPYSEWLSSRNINLENFQRTDFALMYSELFKASVGSDIIVAPNLTEIQQAMSLLLTTFSSYSIQLVGYVNSTNVLDLKRPAIRMHVDGTQMNYEYSVPVSMIRTMSVEYGADVKLSQQLAQPVNQTDLTYSSNIELQSLVRMYSRFDQLQSFVFNMNVEKTSPRLLSFEIVED